MHSADIKKEIVDEILESMDQDHKSIPSKYFYDETGSKLFEEICELDEYYLTRTEMKILSSNIKDISAKIGDHTLLVEFGSGSSLKTRLLLNNLNNIAGYIPIDISGKHLIDSTEKLKCDFPNLNIIPLVEDFTKEFALPDDLPYHKTITIFFPGSTIGNFNPEDAASFIKRCADLTGSKGKLLIGFDLKKDLKIIEAAYNDKKGITAKFNLNILNNLNSLTSSDFRTRFFKHYAFYNENRGRIEMHLISRTDQIVNINGTEIFLRSGEKVLTEYSYKYSIEEFKALLKNSFDIKNIWTDNNNYFAVVIAD